MKKGITITTLASLGICTLICILSIFGVFSFSGVVLNLVFTFGTIVVAGALSLNSLTLLQAKNKWGLVSIILLATSSILTLLIIWINSLSNVDVLVKITATIAILSVVCSLIITNAIKLQKKLIGVQIPIYVIIGITAILIDLLICGVSIFKVDIVGKLFWVLVVLSIVGLITISILSNKNNSIKAHSEPIKNNDDTVTISKQEYEELLKFKEQVLNSKKEN